MSNATAIPAIWEINTVLAKRARVGHTGAMRRRDIERALSAVEALVRAGYDTASFAEQLANLLQPVIPHAAACIVTIDPATRLVTSTYKFGSLAGNHDLDTEWASIEYGTDDPTRMIAIALEEVPARATSHLPGGTDDSVRIRTLIGPAGYHDELRMVARCGDGLWGGVNLFRTTDQQCFDHDEVLVLAALSEIVAEGLRIGLIARCAASLDSEVPSGPAVLIVDSDANLQRVSAGSTEIFDELAVESNRSPMDSLVHGLAAAARQFAAGESPLLPRARLRSPSGRWLVAHAAPLAAHDGVTDEVVITIDEARPPEIMPLLASAFGLSSREREVTQLVLGGSDTKGIASKLSMSAYTVQDHLKSIFDKADVRSRRELVARVFFDQYAPRFTDDVSPTGWYNATTPTTQPSG